MKKIIPILLIGTFFNLLCFAQSSELKNIKASISQIKDSLRYIDALNRLGMLMYEKNVDSTFYYTKIARECSMRLNYEQGKADALNNLGVFFDIKGNLQLAMRYYNEANMAYTQLKDTANEVQTTMNIAMVYRELGKDDKAIQRFDIAMKNVAGITKDSINSLVIYNYLLAYPSKFDKIKKTQLIEKAQSIARKYKDERVLLAIDQLVADDLIAEGEVQKGIDLLDKTIKDGFGKKLYYFTMDLLIDIGDQLLQADESRALAYYKQGLEIAEKNSYSFYSEVIAKKLFDFHKGKHDDLSASLYSSKLVKMYEEKEAANAASGIDYIEYVLNQQQLDALRQRSNYQVILLLLILVICISVISFLFVLRKNLKRTRYLNKKVVSQNSQLKQVISSLEHSQQENAKMMKIVAHDLRNPMAGISAMTDLLLTDKERSARDIKAFGLMSKAAKDALGLVSDLLNYNTLSGELKKEDVDMRELIEYCVSMLRDKAESKAQEIKLELIPSTILATREKLWRVISNLISNAIKFSSRDSEILIKMESVDGYVRILVADQGIGIPEDLQAKVFDVFTKARRKGTDGETPVGLGLFISKQIIEAHSGKIWFESKEGLGTSFYIDLPAA
ncbi:tetratricopeptide repeat-containing sensor histidine kinase [Pedobacter aquatilis]|uniref:ATP-binding protein n=1 Tax=Pedobacter aquatilis TaxID=351343 RepID=UPI002930CE81|nr:tetratricopeptide repeat-containing sensor histidine kinase [Pedobacter aquatilis]